MNVFPFSIQKNYLVKKFGLKKLGRHVSELTCLDYLDVTLFKVVHTKDLFYGRRVNHSLQAITESLLRPNLTFVTKV